MNTVSVDVAIVPGFRVTVDGVGVAPTLLMEAVRDTLPEKPEILATVIVAVPVSPARTVMEAGVTVTVNPVRLSNRTT